MTTTDAPPATSARVETTDGASLHVRRVGAGPPFLLVHGITASLEDWASLEPLLVAAGREVVSFDLRGHGRSSIGTKGCTTDRLALDVVEVLEACDLENAVVCGHSLGGYAVLAAAALHAGRTSPRTARLALIGTTPTARALRELLVFGFVASPAAALLQRTRLPGWWAMRLVNFGDHAASATVADVRRRWSSCPMSTRWAYVSGLVGDDLVRHLGAVDQSVLVVRGTRDLVAADQRSRLLELALPHAELVRLPGVGHALPLEAPEQLASLLLQSD